jgi:hypothetical protein
MRRGIAPSFWMRSALALAFTLALGATCNPPADTDGVRTGAGKFPLGEARSDQVACPSGCGGKGGDCGDWWLVQAPGKGKLHVELANEPLKDGDGNAKPLDPRVGLVVKLVDGGGADLSRAEAVGDAAAAITSKATEGNYFVLIEPLDPKRKGATPYSLRVAFEAPKPKVKPSPPPPPPVVRQPPPPPPPPRFQTLTTAILEIEGPPGRPTHVLLEGGRSAGLRAGLAGRIVDGGRTIAPVEITEVFEGGSKARIVGPPAGRITPASEVQIDVPAGGP